MRYECKFPFCKYCTNNRNKIHFHHIIPRELGGVDNDRNIIELCPNHHSLIYVPESLFGVHSIRDLGSIIIRNRYLSSDGWVLEYERDFLIYYYFYSDGKEVLV